jgi:hypothetical protein
MGQRYELHSKVSSVQIEVTVARTWESLGHMGGGYCSAVSVQYLRRSMEALDFSIWKSLSEHFFLINSAW